LESKRENKIVTKTSKYIPAASDYLKVNTILDFDITFDPLAVP